MFHHGTLGYLYTHPGMKFLREKTRNKFNMSNLFLLVAHTGFEPVISALRGRCPRPLDECALLGFLPLLL